MVTSKPLGERSGAPLQVSPSSGELVCGRHTSNMHVVLPTTGYKAEIDRTGGVQLRMFANRAIGLSGQWPLS